MDRSVPAGAATLLDFIGSIEAPLGYDVIYGNNQSRLKTPITSRTIDQLIKAQSDFTRRYGSSASGRYQFMKATLQGLKKELGLSGSEIFSPDLQDRLGYHLLKRRGYAEFMAGTIDIVDFGKQLAMEWASFPVLSACRGAHRQLSRGQSYYAGDALNRALVSPERVTAVIRQAYEAEHAPTEKPVVLDPAPSLPADTLPPPVLDSRSPVAQGIAVAAMAVLAGVAAWGADVWHWLVG